MLSLATPKPDSHRRDGDCCASPGGGGISMNREASFAPPILCQMLSVDSVRQVLVSDLCCCLFGVATDTSIKHIENKMLRKARNKK